MGEDKTTIVHRYETVFDANAIEVGYGITRMGLRATFYDKQEFLDSLNKNQITNDKGTVVKLEANDFKNKKGLSVRNGEDDTLFGNIPSQEEADHEWNVFFRNVDLTDSTEYILIIKGDEIAMIDSRIFPSDKLGLYLKWWGEYGGYNYKNNQTIEPEFEEEVEKQESQYRLSASPQYAPEVNVGGGSGDPLLEGTIYD